VFEGSDGRCDLRVSGLPDQSDGEVAQRGHDPGPCPGPDLGGVLAERDVAHPVDLVLDAPVPAHVRHELFGSCFARGHRGDPDLGDVRVLIKNVRQIERNQRD